MAQGPRRQGSEGPRPGGLYLGEGVRSESRVREAQASATSPYRHASALIQGLFRAGAKALTATQTVREHPCLIQGARQGAERRARSGHPRGSNPLFGPVLCCLFLASQPVPSRPQSWARVLLSKIPHALIPFHTHRYHYALASGASFYSRQLHTLKLRR